MRTQGIITFIAASVLLFISSCNREPVPPPEPQVDYVTIGQLRGMADAGVVTIDTNIYIQGIITLTPELGNLPSMIAYVQDTTAGICLTVSGTNTFSMDSEVRILCRGVSFSEYNGLLQFGDISIADQTTLISLTPVLQEPQVVTIEQLLAGGHQAEYVRLESVEFTGTGTYEGQQTITDCSDDLEVYTRQDATFAQDQMPAGNGFLKGVASNYDGVQLLLRDGTENDMTGTRCSASGTVYLSESFESLEKYEDASTLAGWETYPEKGTKTWYCNYVNSTKKWIQATAYNSGQAEVRTWMITPAIGLSSASSPYVSFTSANGYDNGATLKLYASVDYNGSATPWTSTWTQLTFTMPPLASDGWSDFISSGKVSLSSFKGGVVYIAWVYDGGSSRTTTWEVDEVLVAEE